MKQKTVKSLSKRFKVTGSKTNPKLRKVKSGQNHFNTSESGKVKRNKRQDAGVSNAKQHRAILKLVKN